MKKSSFKEVETRADGIYIKTYIIYYIIMYNKNMLPLKAVKRINN